MIFIASNRKSHLLDNFWMFKTENTEYITIYIYVENYIYEKFKEAVEYIKTKKHSLLGKIYNVYIIRTPKCDSFSLVSIKECYSPNR